MIKFPSDFRLPSLSVFDIKRNYWVNLAQSAIPKELESKIHLVNPSTILALTSNAPLNPILSGLWNYVTERGGAIMARMDSSHPEAVSRHPKAQK